MQSAPFYLRYIRSKDVLSERCRNEDGGESTDSTHEGGIAHIEVLVANVFVLLIAPAVDNNPKDNEDLAIVSLKSKETSNVGADVSIL
jgi:hypothetical protein